jgi:hypothetical protein
MHMGMMLMLLSEPDVPGPELFPHSDGKQFHGTFFGPGVPILEAWSRLDLSALRYCALDTEGADEAAFGAEQIAQWQAESELAWQSPAVLIQTLEALLARLQRAKNRLPLDVCWALDPYDRPWEYYREGHLSRDVESCLAAVRARAAAGAQRVRFFAI